MYDGPGEAGPSPYNAPSGAVFANTLLLALSCEPNLKFNLMRLYSVSEEEFPSLEQAFCQAFDHWNHAVSSPDRLSFTFRPSNRITPRSDMQRRTPLITDRCLTGRRLRPATQTLAHQASTLVSTPRNIRMKALMGVRLLLLFNLISMADSLGFPNQLTARTGQQQSERLMALCLLHGLR